MSLAFFVSNLRLASNNDEEDKDDDAILSNKFSARRSRRVVSPAHLLKIFCKSSNANAAFAV